MSLLSPGWPAIAPGSHPFARFDAIALAVHTAVPNLLCWWPPWGDREEVILRITRGVDGPGLATLKLEGGIVSDWVALLEGECLRALRDTRTLVLDLSAVTFIDSAGVTMLRSIARENLEIVHASPLVAELLRAGLDQ